MVVVAELEPFRVFADLDQPDQQTVDEPIPTGSNREEATVRVQPEAGVGQEPAGAPLIPSTVGGKHSRRQTNLFQDRQMPRLRPLGQPDAVPLKEVDRSRGAIKVIVGCERSRAAV